MRYVLAAALVVPILAGPGMAQNAASVVDQHVYQGGPKSSIPHATRQHVTGSDNALAMAPTVPRRATPHGYSGGPQTVVPHSY
jgi:hypothetical protein